jgi:hypothetical protein
MMSATYAESNSAAQPPTLPGGRFIPGTRQPTVFASVLADPAFPGWGIDACGHCGTAFTGEDPGLFCWELPLERLRGLAYQAGWVYDSRWIWTCPGCQQDPGWLSLHRTLEVRTPDAPAEQPACGGPGVSAGLAVDVMLTSHDYPDLLRSFDRRARKILGPHRLGGEFDPSRWRAGHRAPVWRHEPPLRLRRGGQRRRAA